MDYFHGDSANVTNGFSLNEPVGSTLRSSPPPTAQNSMPPCGMAFDPTTVWCRARPHPCHRLMCPRSGLPVHRAKELAQPRSVLCWFLDAGQLSLRSLLMPASKTSTIGDISISNGSMRHFRSWPCVNCKSIQPLIFLRSDEFSAV
jgi:hypothetical protein